MSIKEFSLENGLTVILNPIESMKSISICACIRVGSSYESKEENGISHFLEHLALAGTRKWKTSRELSEVVEGLGGFFGAFTGKEFSCFWIKVPYQFLETAVEVMSEIVLFPLLKERAIEEERKVVIQEIEQIRRSNLRSWSFILWDKVAWPNHPLGQPILGTKETVLRLNKQHLLQFRSKYYHGKNIAISCAGNMQIANVITIISRYFSTCPLKERAKFRTTKIKQNSHRIAIFNENTNQIHIALGFRALGKRNPQKYTLRVLSVLLGEGVSSRLFQKLRASKGLVYHAGTHVQSFLNTGIMMIYTVTELDKFEEVLYTIVREIGAIRRGEITKKEMERARNYLKGNWLFKWEDTLNQAIRLGEWGIFEKGGNDINSLLAEIDQVTMEDMLKTAQEIFTDDRLNLVLLGPKSRLLEKKRSLDELVKNHLP
jgi:predicted Zn-dependent peptidase